MPTTDIRVYGFARDIRTSDRAEVRLKVSGWGHDATATHETVTDTVESVLTTLKDLAAKHPDGLAQPWIGQHSQKNWSDDIGASFSECVRVNAVFTDFEVMSQWIFHVSTEMVKVERITWGFQDDTKNEIDIALSIEAVNNARRQAETFAVAAGLDITGIRTIADPNLLDADRPEPVDTPIADDVTAHQEQHMDTIDITPAVIETTAQIAVHFIAEPEQA
ncbi:MAG: SIMPL domain-containing protein [Propionibacteriaceae bacterium]|nr:SIMPL domain-containing protein [Propionibacteriaceae bacterium]